MLLAMIPVVEVSTFGYYACPYCAQFDDWHWDAVV
jgi:hypothetical protein